MIAPMPTPALTPTELASALATLPGWSLEDGALARTYRFLNFRTAMAFMQAVAEDIDRLDHHPEWTNSYNRITVRLSTQDAGHVVTAKDVALARIFDQHMPGKS